VSEGLSQALSSLHGIGAQRAAVRTSSAGTRHPRGSRKSRPAKTRPASLSGEDARRRRIRQAPAPASDMLALHTASLSRTGRSIHRPEQSHYMFAATRFAAIRADSKLSYVRLPIRTCGQCTGSKRARFRHALQAAAGTDLGWEGSKVEAAGSYSRGAAPGPFVYAHEPASPRPEMVDATADPGRTQVFAARRRKKRRTGGGSRFCEGRHLLTELPHRARGTRRKPFKRLLANEAAARLGAAILGLAGPC